MKFSFEEKLRAVKLHLEAGCYEIPKEYVKESQKCSYRNQVKTWEGMYLARGEEGLRHVCNNFHSPERKLEMIAPVLDGCMSASSRAHELGIEPATLRRWAKDYSEKGIVGLKCSKFRRPSKNMKEKEQDVNKSNPAPSTEGDAEEELKRLRHENLLLKAELAYRKKLKALMEREGRGTPSRRSQSRKQSKSSTE